MRDDELQKAIRGLAPVTDDQVRRMDIGEGETALLDEISGSAAPKAAPTAEHAPAPRPRRRRRGFRIRAGAVAVAAAAALALLLVFGIGSSNDPAQGPEFASAAVRVAKANPRLLVTAPGWKVTSADEFEVDSGQMEFGNGSATLSITWYPARFYNSYHRDRAQVGATPVQFKLLGRPTSTVSYSSGEFATMLLPQGKTFVEIRANLSFAEYRKVLGSLEPTSVRTWLAALPASVVQPVDRKTVVDSMLEDIPLPPGFDAGPLEDEDSVLSNYQLGAKVTGAVACDWLGRWVDATKSGNEDAAAQAAEAMATSQHWKILDQMNNEGAWSRVLRSYGDAIQPGPKAPVLNGGSSENPDRFKASYTSGLGCGDQP